MIEKSFHVVFDRKVSWAKNLHVIGWIALESHIEKVKDYFIMQAIKEKSTIGKSPKGNKPCPRIVFHYGSQNGQIKIFLEKRQCIKETLKENERLKLPSYCPDLDCLVRHLDEKKLCESSCFWMMRQIEEVSLECGKTLVTCY